MLSLKNALARQVCCWVVGRQCMHAAAVHYAQGVRRGLSLQLSAQRCMQSCLALLPAPSCATLFCPHPAPP